MVVDTLSFGKALERIASVKKLKKADVAKLINKTDGAVSRLMADKSSPSIDTALKTLEPLGYILAVVKNDADLPQDACFLHQLNSKSEE